MPGDRDRSETGAGGAGGDYGRPRATGDPSVPSASARPPGRVGSGLLAASKFLGRLAQLDRPALGEAVQTWHRTVVADSAAWFGAETAVARAVHEARRHAEQEILLRHMADLFIRAPWFSAEQPDARIDAAAPAGEYVATLAMLAVLARDRLTGSEFEMLYRPFARRIPLEELEQE
jgi:hypothetical protein